VGFGCGGNGTWTSSERRRQASAGVKRARASGERQARIAIRGNIFPLLAVFDLAPAQTGLESHFSQTDARRKSSTLDGSKLVAVNYVRPPTKITA
jgi:hypothetical protein